MKQGIRLPVAEGAWAHVPAPLPPVWRPDPILLREAEVALSEWNARKSRADDGERLERVAEEVATSCRIEGIEVSPEEVLRRLSHPGEEPVRNLAEAHLLLPSLAPQNPSRLSQELHALLFRGAETPFPRGRYRTIQVWIGGKTLREARYIPPPPLVVEGTMAALDEFVAKESLPPLLEALLLHYQFVAIHPFPDGNGRVGRLLVQAHLLRRKALGERSFPLPLSPHLSRHRQAYYEALQAVSEKGDWEAWGRLFLEGVIAQAQD